MPERLQHRVSLGLHPLFIYFFRVQRNLGGYHYWSWIVSQKRPIYLSSIKFGYQWDWP